MLNIFLSVRGWVVCQADNIPGWKNTVVIMQVLVDFCLFFTRLYLGHFTLYISRGWKSTHLCS